MNATRPIILLTLLFVFPLSERVCAATLAGEVNAQKGSVTATGTDGQVRELGKGRPIFEGDRIDTAKRAAIELRFQDGTKFTLGGSSTMAVDAFLHGRSVEEDTFSVKILKGAFRFLTGLLAKKRPRSMTVQLAATVTVGIRGTNVAGELVGEAAKVVLLEPEEPGVATAIEVFNEHGSTTIDQPGFGTEVPDANSPPSPARRMRLRTIDNLLRSMRSVTPALTRPPLLPRRP